MRLGLGFGMVLWATTAFSQTTTIQDAVLNFSYTAPPGWLIYTAANTPGKSVQFEVRNPAYTWTMTFNITSASTYIEASQNAVFRNWQALKTIINQQLSAVLEIVYDTLDLNGIYTANIGLFYPLDTRANAFLQYSGSYHSTTFTYFCIPSTNKLVSEGSEITKVRSGFVVGITASAKASAQPPLHIDPVLQGMVDALGRPLQEVKTPRLAPLFTPAFSW